MFVDVSLLLCVAWRVKFVVVCCSLIDCCCLLLVACYSLLVVGVYCALLVVR